MESPEHRVTPIHLEDLTDATLGLGSERAQLLTAMPLETRVIWSQVSGRFGRTKRLFDVSVLSDMRTETPSYVL